MPNITLNTKLYSSSGFLNGVAGWTERSAGILAGFSGLRGSLRSDSKVRVKWDFNVPIIATEDSACSCAGTVLRKGDVDVSIRMDPSLTLAERTDLADRLVSLVSDVTFRASIINLEMTN